MTQSERIQNQKNAINSKTLFFFFSGAIDQLCPLRCVPLKIDELKWQRHSPEAPLIWARLCAEILALTLIQICSIALTISKVVRDLDTV